MFPAAFCAGMSLPLITFALLGNGHGESSIGKVYAWNTAGAIVGVLFAVHIGMPLLGLKNLIVAAASVDIGVAVALLVLVRHNSFAVSFPIVASMGVIALISATMFVEFDLQKTSSGVYRHGRLRAADAEIIFHKDGKTATVDVVKTGVHQAILTNGKADAAIVLGDEASAGDEPTMVLLAVLPLAHKPDARKIANIGFGSGLTTHTLLGSATVETVDTIEIEPAMVEGAQRFGDSVKRAYSDPRSRIHFDDAKSFFAGRNEKYDVIVSEPSNPWVSGVSGLFSNEFYSRIKTYLKDDGVLVQWIQLYEIDSELVSSMLSALGNHFTDYVAYEVGSSDIVIVAVPKGAVPPLTRAPFDSALIAHQLHRIGINDFRDLAIRRIGSKKHLQLAVHSFGIPANSDYFPIVDLRASRQRFLGRDAMEFIQLAAAPMPTMDLLEQTAFTDVMTASKNTALYSHRPQRAMVARNLRELLMTGTLGPEKLLAPELALRASYMRDGLINCVDTGKRTTSFEFMFDIGTLVSSHLSPADSAQVWRAIENTKCYAGIPARDRDWIGLFRAVGNRDSREIALRAESLMAANATDILLQKEYLLAAGMTGYIVNGDKNAALSLWKKYGKALVETGKVSVQMRILVAMANENTGNMPGRRPLP
jgi:spermidine synthase